MPGSTPEQNGGPKGVGALVLADGLNGLEAAVRGGGQEKGRRAGTENVPGIVGFAAAVQAAMASLDGDMDRVEKLRLISRRFYDSAKARGWNTGTSAGLAIIPFMAGNSIRAVALSQKLFERGINVQPIIHPAVPERAARLRFFLTSEHRAEQIGETIEAIGDAMNEISESATLQNIPGFSQGDAA